MFDFYEKRKIRNLIYSKFSIGVVFLLALWLGTSVYERFTVEQEMVDRRVEKQTELETLKERAALLEAKVDHLKNDRGIEEELRSRFDVAKDGEKVVILLDNKDTTNTDLEAMTQPPPPKSSTSSFSFLKFLKFW